MKMRFRAVFAVGLAALTISGCSMASDNSAIDQEQIETSTITVYSGRNENFISPFFDEFTAQTGINIEARYGDSAELAALLLEEGKNSPADVFLSQDAGAIGAVAAQDLFKTLDSGDISVVSEQFRDPNSKWVGITGRSRIIAYNNKKYSESDLPKTIDELLDPKWSGKIAIAPTNASFQSFITAVVQLRGEEKTLEWLKGLNANNPQMFEKNSQMVEAIDQEVVDLGLTNHYYVAEVSQNLGREINVGISFFNNQDAGNLLNVSALGILQTSKKQEQSLKLVKYLLSKSTQEKFVNETYEYSLLNGVAAPTGLPLLDQLGIPNVRLGQLTDVAKTQELLITSGLL
jgi:iron(III) transport system substrate-binding protein